MDGTVLPDRDIINTHPSSSTNAIRSPISPVPTTTLPRRVVCCEKKKYLSPFIRSQFRKNDTAISATLEMQPIEYCRFLTSMAELGSTSKSQLPNLVAKIQGDKIIVTIELSNTIYNELQEWRGTKMTVSAIIVFYFNLKRKQNVTGTLT
jgi:hypothetical protein